MSYSRNSYDIVHSLVKIVQGYGIKIWFDRTEVEIGSDIIINLESVLSQTTKWCGAIAFFDETYFSKKWCLKELEYFIKSDVSIFPILYKISKTDYPEEYPILQNLHRVTVTANGDLTMACNKILDVYLTKNKDNTMDIPIKSEILNYLVSDFWYASKNEGQTLIKADNIGLYIQNYFRINNIFMDKHIKVLVNILDKKLRDYYSTEMYTDLDLKLACKSAEQLIHYINFPNEFY